MNTEELIFIQKLKKKLLLSRFYEYYSLNSSSTQYYSMSTHEYYQVYCTNFTMKSTESLINSQ